MFRHSGQLFSFAFFLPQSLSYFLSLSFSFTISFLSLLILLFIRGLIFVGFLQRLIFFFLLKGLKSVLHLMCKLSLSLLLVHTHTPFLTCSHLLSFSLSHSVNAITQYPLKLSKALIRLFLSMLAMISFFLFSLFSFLNRPFSFIKLSKRFAGLQTSSAVLCNFPQLLVLHALDTFEDISTSRTRDTN